MKIKLDENLPERLVAALQALGHDVDTVRAERLAGQDDADVWHATQAAGRFFITQDLDFSDVRLYTPGTHAGLLLVRLAQPGLRLIRISGHLSKGVYKVTGLSHIRRQAQSTKTDWIPNGEGGKPTHVPRLHVQDRQSEKARACKHLIAAAGAGTVGAG